MRAGRVLRLAEQREQAVVEHVLDERRLAGAADARDTDETVQRNRNVDVLQVVLASAADHEPRIGVGHGTRGPAAPDRQRPAQVLRRQRVAARRELPGRPVEHDLAAGPTGPGAHVDDAIGREHDLRVVLDDEQRVAGVAQLLEHVDDAAQVARMQADARLVEHEQRVDERRAERRRQIDALHLAARQRA